jgi:imidazolonepropionase-like amidohydrolase
MLGGKSYTFVLKPTMKTRPSFFISLAIWAVAVACSSCRSGAPAETGPPPLTILTNLTLIDGTGQSPQQRVALVIRDSLLQEIVPAGRVAGYDDARVVDLGGKTIMPLMINAHAHVGLLRGTEISPDHYTRQNVERQLKQYLAFGIGTVVSLGTDQELVFELREQSRTGQLEGATLYTAGFGISAPNGVPPATFGANQVLRPASAEEAREAVRQLKERNVDFVKVWVDDGGGRFPKIQPEVYGALIEEARRQDIPVAVHVYYLEDAKRLAELGVSVIAHSVRDSEVDASFIQTMLDRNITYIPTLSLDAYNFVYEQEPEWMQDPFFQASLEPGVLEMLRSEEYRQKIAADPDLKKKKAAFERALRNVKRLYDAGVRIALGSDSGAQPVRAQGFSEHLELQEMVNAGLTPLQAIGCATKNSAELLGLLTTQGTLEPGKKANFIILDANPAEDIRHTRQIRAVWRNGQLVSGEVQ